MMIIIRKQFFVSISRDKCEIICSCNLFEFQGIVCRHAIAVLIQMMSNHYQRIYFMKIAERCQLSLDEGCSEL